MIAIVEGVQSCIFLLGSNDLCCTFPIQPGSQPPVVAGQFVSLIFCLGVPQESTKHP